MAKYRLLSNAELKELKKEFIEYLILNGIDADQWQGIKKKDTQAANKMIDLFSDVVFEKILRQAKYLKKIEPNNLVFIQCNEDKMNMFAFKSSNNQFVFNELQVFDFKSIIENAEIIKGAKAYKLERQLELFNMIEQGFEIDDGENFNIIKVLLNNQ